jgi:hypothetical protein
MALRGVNTEVIDLGNRTVIPGLNDSQMHPIRGGLNYNMELRWDGVPSLADATRTHCGGGGALRLLLQHAQSSAAGPSSSSPSGACRRWKFFKMEHGPPQRLPLTLFMSDKEPIWNRLVKKHSLLDWSPGGALPASSAGLRLDGIWHHAQLRQHR